MNWFERAIEHEAGIVARVLTQQYITSMKALGFEAVHVVTEKESTGCSNGKIYCYSEEDYCIIDSDDKGFYMVHRENCPLNEFAPFDGIQVVCKKHQTPYSQCRKNGLD